jgi:hypothetical protein
MWQIDAHESNEVAMARYREENPKVHVEYEFFAARNMMKNEDDAGPSTMIEQEEDDPFYMDTDWDDLARSDGE